MDLMMSRICEEGWVGEGPSVIATASHGSSLDNLHWNACPQIEQQLIVPIAALSKRGESDQKRSSDLRLAQIDPLLSLFSISLPFSFNFFNFFFFISAIWDLI